MSLMPTWGPKMFLMSDTLSAQLHIRTLTMGACFAWLPQFLECPLGYFHGPCTCSRCTNAPTSSVYLTSTVEKCSWACLEGFYKSVSNRSEECVACVKRPCALGEALSNPCWFSRCYLFFKGIMHHIGSCLQKDQFWRWGTLDWSRSWYLRNKIQIYSGALQCPCPHNIWSIPSVCGVADRRDNSMFDACASILSRQL